MEWIVSVWEAVVSFIVTLSFSDIVDFLIVALIFYYLMRLFWHTSVIRVLFGVGIIMAALFLSELFSLSALNFLLAGCMQFGFLTFIILFQKELRQVLEDLGRGRVVDTVFTLQPDELDKMISEIVDACKSMSETKTGALMVFERSKRIEENLVNRDKVKVIDAAITDELIKNIFYKGSPLHDGAAIVCNGRMHFAGAFLPVSESRDIPQEFGARHRAAMSICQISDCLALVVSEETGGITLMIGASDSVTINRGITPEELRRLLYLELSPKDKGEAATKNVFIRVKEFFRSALSKRGENGK